MHVGGGYGECVFGSFGCVLTSRISRGVCFEVFSLSLLCSSRFMCRLSLHSDHFVKLTPQRRRQSQEPPQCAATGPRPQEGSHSPECVVSSSRAARLPGPARPDLPAPPPCVLVWEPALTRSDCTVGHQLEDFAPYMSARVDSS